MIRIILTNILRGLNRKVNKADWKDLRTTTPVSDIFGYDRDIQSVHRYYVDNFVASHADKIKGTVLEVGDSMYIDRFKEKINDYNVIHYSDVKSARGFVADLTKKETIPAAKFDCFICTQTFNFIYDIHRAIEGAHHLLKPGGYLIATVSGIQQISKYDHSRWGDYWRLTDIACTRAFGDVFGREQVKVQSFGNVLSAISALEGFASSELSREEMNHHDPAYPIIIGIIAQKLQR